MPEPERVPSPAYERVRVVTGASAEVVWLRWHADVPSAVHDHGGGVGVVIVCAGRIRERVFEDSPTGPVLRHERVHSAPACFAVSAATLHTMESIGGRPSRSLHAYVGARDRMRVYDPARSAFVRVADGTGATLPVDERTVVEPRT